MRLRPYRVHCAADGTADDLDGARVRDLAAACDAEEAIGQERELVHAERIQLLGRQRTQIDSLLGSLIGDGR